MSNDLVGIRDSLRAFSAERDWDQFHTPKNLALAVMVEAGELLEHFQWLTDEQSQKLPPEVRSKVSEEMADVLGYLIRLADKLEIDLLDSTRRKIEQNAKKYPAEKARGNAKKYTEL